jgi:DNA-binding NtrC family response regulator
MPARILVVDDERLIRWTIQERLGQEGHLIEEAGTGSAAREALQNRSFDAALVDLRLPDTDGVALLKEAHRLQPDLPVIIITAYSSIEGAVGAIKAGAVDYIAKPFNVDELALTVARVLDTSRMRRALNADLRQKKALFGLDHLVGESPRILEIRSLLERVAKGHSTTVLLLGESGTGKDIAARAIHYESHRATFPFMNITCTALPESLLESELFGYEAGAFTNATSQKKGLFELAHGGTVLMDEIGDMPPALQAKLLRVLEEKAFKRIGGAVDINVDVRVVAATNRHLEKMIQSGTFREDLYYRLSIVPIVMPPLRERPEDIPLLAQHFLETYNREFRRQFNGLTAAALRKLNQYPWPGNVRELRNVIERAVLLSAGERIDADDIVLGRVTFGASQPDTGEVIALPPGGCTLADAEMSLVRQALRRCHWNLTRAGAMLGVSRDQVRYKIEKFGLKEEQDSLRR